MKAIREIAVAAAILFATPALADAPSQGLRVVVPAHDIQRGDTISDSDLVYQTLSDSSLHDNLATSIGDLSGMEARRFLYAGQPVRLDDVRHPIVVTKGSTVTMTYDAPGISLSAIGKAMSEGGVGDSVVVLNPVSYRQITGVVTGPGTVRAPDMTATVTSPAQIAAAQFASSQGQ